MSIVLQLTAHSLYGAPLTLGKSTFKLRQRNDGMDLDEAAVDFYRQRFTADPDAPPIASLQDVDGLIKRRAEGDRFLHMTERDLLGEDHADFDHEAFPEALELGEERLHLSYAYRPGQEDDGVTVKVP